MTCCGNHINLPFRFLFYFLEVEKDLLHTCSHLTFHSVYFITRLSSGLTGVSVGTGICAGAV